MAKLLRMIFKNFKLIIRSKVSAMVTIFGPLIITLLVGLAFNNASTYDIKIGLYTAERNELVSSFVDEINAAQFRVTELTSEQECKDYVRQGVVNICMAFPENFEIAQDDNNEVNNEIMFFVDPSKINLVYSVIDMISARVETRTQEISSELTTVILTTLDESKATIKAQDSNFKELADSTTYMKNKHITMKQRLSDLNLDVNTDEFSVGDLKSVNRSLANAFVGENSTLREMMNESLYLVGNIIDDIEDSLIFNGTSIHDDTLDLEDQLFDLEDEIKDIDTDDLDKLSDTIMLIEDKLTELEEEMKKASDSRTVITREINELNTELDSNINKLNKIKANLQGIVTNIDSIAVTEASTIVSPIKTKIEPVVSETYLNYMFPALIVLVVMLVAILFSSTVVMMEKGSKAWFRNLVIPTPDWLYLLAALISTLILLALQLVLILGLSYFVFNVNILSNILPNLVLLFLSALLFSLIGILIGVSFTSAETSTLGAISIASLSLFLSDIILPLESMPAYLIDIARFNPFVLGEYLLRRSLLFSASLPKMIEEGYFVTTISPLLILLMYIGFFGIVLIVLNYLGRKHLMTRYMKKLAPKPIEEQHKEIDIAGKEVDTSKKTELLIEEAMHAADTGNHHRASQLYLHITEAYANLPKEKKKEHFKKIVELHEKIKQAKR
ncbi:ABC transporter permease [Candidatus Woesearchaeota archaeon]|nr:ABC transporter permease [Candidatus Woesearchaeota archaeon]